MNKFVMKSQRLKKKKIVIWVNPVVVKNKKYVANKRLMMTVVLKKVKF